MPDPFADLRTPLTPLAPRRAFAADLRRRLEAEIHPTDPEPERTPMHVTTMFPHLVSNDARAAMRFYEDAFDAEVDYVLDMPDGRVGHAELKIHGFSLAIGDPFPEEGFLGPTEAMPPTSLTLYVDDCDAALARAVAAGAEVERPAADQFYGHRTAVIRDPGGHRWFLQQVLRDMTADEMQAAMLEDEGQ